jgi:hypothetical protein
MMAKLDAHHKKMMARMDSQLEKMDTTILEANREKMEATDLEANPEETESELENYEVPREGAAVENIGALEDQYLARTQGDGGSWKKLAATR